MLSEKEEKFLLRIEKANKSKRLFVITNMIFALAILVMIGSSVFYLSIFNQMSDVEKYDRYFASAIIKIILWVFCGWLFIWARLRERRLIAIIGKLKEG